MVIGGHAGESLASVEAEAMGLGKDASLLTRARIEGFEGLKAEEEEPAFFFKCFFFLLGFGRES